VVVDHPQHDVFHAAETGVLRDFEWNAVLLAYGIAVMAVDQHVVPQHQRIAAAFGQDAALQRRVFRLGQRVDVSAQGIVDLDLHKY
jgi:hypothetical protein